MFWEGCTTFSNCCSCDLFFFFFLLVPLLSTWDLSSPTRDGTHAPCSGSAALTTGTPGNSAVEIFRSLLLPALKPSVSPGLPVQAQLLTCDSGQSFPPSFRDQAPSFNSLLIIGSLLPSQPSPNLDHLQRATAALTPGPSLNLNSVSEVLLSAAEPHKDIYLDINASTGTNANINGTHMLTPAQERHLLADTTGSRRLLIWTAPSLLLPWGPKCCSWVSLLSQFLLHPSLWGWSILKPEL